MTGTIDILGRPPVMRPIAHEDMQPDDDWRGLSIMANIPRHQGGTVNVQTALAAKKPSPKFLGQSTGGVCAVDGCKNPLNVRNKMRVCQEHRHATECQCLQCKGKRERGLK